MSIADVMSRVDAIGQLADQAAAPTAPPATSTSFGDALASATTGLGTAAAATTGLGTAAAATATSSAAPTAAELELQLVSAFNDPDTSDPSSDSSSSGIDSLTQLLATGGLSASALATPATSTSSTSPSAAGNVLAAAQSQVGVSEEPPGSNDGPQLDTYRSAVAGSEPGQPWCADFASWAAAQGGEPLGAQGQGLGSVAEITGWAQSTGRLLPASATPTPGDLILFGDRHVGVVESVNPNGSLTTVEGNYANAVTRVQRSPSEATGYVQL